MRNRYRNKIFLIYSTLILILMTALTSVLYIQVSQSIRRENRHNLEAMILSRTQQLDLQLNIALSALNAILTSHRLEGWAYSGGKEYYYNSLLIQEELRRNVQSLVSIGYDVAVSFAGPGYSVISRDSSMDKASFYKQRLGIPEISSDDMEKELQSGVGFVRRKSLTGLVKNGLSINTIHMISYGDRDIFIYLMIDQNSFLSSPAEMSGDWFIEKNTGKILTGTASFPSRPGDLPRSPLDRDAPLEYSRQTGEGEYRVASRVSDWNYIYLLPQQEVKIPPYLYSFILLWILGIGLSLLTAWKLTQILYNPILSILGAFSTEEEEIKALDEFEFFRSKAREISANSEILREKYYKDMLYGIRNGELKDSLSLLPPDDSCQAVLFHMEKEGEAPYIPEEIKGKVRRFCGGDGPCVFVDIDHDSFVLIFPDLPSDRKEMLLKQIIEGMEDGNSILAFAALGEPVEDLLQISRSFKEACRIMDFRNSLGLRQIIRKVDLEGLGDRDYYFPLKLENRLVNGALGGNREEVEAVLDMLIDENLTNRRMEPRKRRNFLLSLCASLNRIRQEWQTEIEEPEDAEKLMGELLEMNETPLLKDRLKGLFLELMETTIREKLNRNNQIAEEVLIYIQTNYRRDISLTDIALYLNISEKYSSILFKRATGSNFKDVLNQYRIDQALKILEKDEKTKIKSLAKELGFNSANTFIRVFKKYQGMSPGAYKDKLQKD